MGGKKVGLIGLGAMGRGVAQNLIAKGFELVGFDVRPEMKNWLEERGGQFSKDLADLADQCNVIISFVVDQAQTEDVLFGNGELIKFLKPNTALITCSTMSPSFVSKLGDRLKSASIRLLDAPVTGGAAGAAKGSLTIMCAGDKVLFDEVKPVLDAFGKSIYFVGNKPGAGSQLKVINQLLCGVHLAAAGEALALAKRQGLPLEVTHEVLCSGAANSWMLGDRGPRMVESDFGNVTSAVNIFVKDLGLVAEAAKEAKFSAPISSAALNAFLSVSGKGMGSWDDSAVMCGYNLDPSVESLDLPAKK